MNYNLIVGLLVFFTGFIYIIYLLFNNDSERMEEILKQDESLQLVSLGMFTQNGKVYNLSSYYTDRNGNLYSVNQKTWEVNPRDLRDILICSDSSLDKSGYIVNSLRSIEGVKVTIRRKNIKFEELAKVNPTFSINSKVNQTTKRHLVLVRN